MKVCICKNVIGTKRHLIHDFDEKTYAWSMTVPDDCWSIGDSTRVLDLGDLGQSLSEDLSILPSEKHVRQFRELLGDDVGSWQNKISWQQSLTPDEFKKFVAGLLQKAQEILGNPHAISYSKVLKNDRRAFLGLSRAKVDLDCWRLCRGTADAGQVEAVDSFRPDAQGFAPKIVYGRSETTGRMTVISGPRILHLKKEFRKLIKSRWQGGRIAQLDYVSMEPRILMDLVGRKPEEDVYEYTSRVVLDRVLNRDESKAVVMGVLYGIGTSRLQSILGNKVNAAEVMAEVRSHFGVRILENKLKKELKEKGYITNHYGRILKPQRTDAAGLVSWHVQSTGVDLGMQGFGQLMNRIAEEEMNVTPLFFIHDALLLDVHPDVTDYDLQTLAKVASRPPGFEQEFPLKVTNVDS